MTITVHGKETPLQGRVLKTKSDAPSAVIVNAQGNEIVIGSEQINVQLLLAVPSLKTDVCRLGVIEINTLLQPYEHVSGYIITSDDVDVIKEMDYNKLVVCSDIKGMFGERFGVKISEGILSGKLARAVFIIDKEGIIDYCEIVSEITHDVDYDALMTHLEQTLAKKKKGQKGHHHHGW